MAESFSNSLITNTIYHLLNFEKYSNFPTAAKEAALNNAFQIVLFSSDFNTLFSVETRHRMSIAEAVRKSNEAGFSKEDKHTTRIDMEGITTYWGPITISGEKYYLLLVDNEDNYSKEDISKLAEIIELAMGMWNFSPERNPAAELIRALRRGNRNLAYTVMQELGLQQSDFHGVFFVPGVHKEEGLRTLAYFEDKFKIRTLRIAEEGEIAGLILNDETTLEYGEQDWKDFAKAMSESGAAKTFHVLGTDGIEGMCSAFQLINETEAFIQLIFPYKHSFSKYELALTGNCVNICMNGGAVEKNYMDLIKPFREAKDTKGKQLMDTLETFVLDAGLSTAKTSRLMDIHANTVQYRIKRIKEILGVDITANTIVPGLMMALAVSRIEKEIRSF